MRGEAQRKEESLDSAQGGPCCSHAAPAMPANSRFLVAALLGMTWLIGRWIQHQQVPRKVPSTGREIEHDQSDYTILTHENSPPRNWKDGIAGARGCDRARSQGRCRT